MKPAIRITPTKHPDSFFVNELVKDVSRRWKYKKVPVGGNHRSALGRMECTWPKKA